MLEESFQLHILMDQEFRLDKKRMERVFFGFDKHFAFTKKYLTDSQGDKNLRSQVRSPKDELGVCVALAGETNGSIFSAKKLKPGSRNPIKKIVSAFAKRVASTALPAVCNVCECNGHNWGTAFMTCTHCNNDNFNMPDYGEDDEEVDSSSTSVDSGSAEDN